MSALNTAGGKSVGINFLSCLNKYQHEFSAYVPDDKDYFALNADNVQIKQLPSFGMIKPFRLLADNLVWKRMIAFEKPDVIFSMGNIALPVQGRQAVLFHWPYAIYPESDVWSRMNIGSYISRKIRLYLFRSRLRYASLVIVQTRTVKKRLEDLYGLKNVEVVPNAVSLPSEAMNDTVFPLPESAAGKKKLLCLSRYYPHKNLEIFIRLGELIKEKKLPYCVILTIENNQGKAAGRLIRAIKKNGLEEIIINIGNVEMNKIPSLYNATDGLLLPTLLESFSGTYVEAMYYKKPVFTSDMDFAHDVCGESAYYFDPFSAEEILNIVINAYKDSEQMNQIIKNGYDRVSKMPDWSRVSEMFIKILEKIA